MGRGRTSLRDLPFFACSETFLGGTGSSSRHSPPSQSGRSTTYLLHSVGIAVALPQGHVEARPQSGYRPCAGVECTVVPARRRLAAPGRDCPALRLAPRPGPRRLGHGCGAPGALAEHQKHSPPRRGPVRSHGRWGSPRRLALHPHSATPRIIDKARRSRVLSGTFSTCLAYVTGRLGPSHRRGGFGDDQTLAQPRRSLCPLRGGLQIARDCRLTRRHRIAVPIPRSANDAPPTRLRGV